jgi:clan AA aspartic protease
MGYTYADITILNTGDEEMVRRGGMRSEEIRSVEVRALVDSGAATLIIDEQLKNKLGLSVLREVDTILANGQKQKSEVVGPVTIRFKNREAMCRAFVVPGTDSVLLGVLPIEEMDVIIDPVKHELVLPADRLDVARLRI